MISVLLQCRRACAWAATKTVRCRMNTTVHVCCAELVGAPTTDIVALVLAPEALGSRVAVLHTACL